MYTILDGKKVAKEILSDLKIKCAEYLDKGIQPTLIAIVIGEDEATNSYIKQKKNMSEKIGINFEIINFPISITEVDLINSVKLCNEDKSVHGILVQLPLPNHINVDKILKYIDRQKDVDGFSPYSLGSALRNAYDSNLLPCTPRGVIRLLNYYDIELLGKDIVIIGASNIVGKPLAVMFMNKKATVTVCHRDTKDISFYTKNADIVCIAAGSPKLLTSDMVKDDVVIVDIGISKVEDKLVGDCDFENIKEKSSYISPVPGGVGPMTVISLMENLLLAVKIQSK